MNLKNLETRLDDASKRDDELEQLAKKHTAIFSDWQGQESHVRKLAFKIGYQIAKENITKEAMAQQTMAQEKAVELFKKYYCLSNNSKSKLKVIEYECAKKCALIAVDEILESQPRYPSEVDWDDCGATHEYYGVAQREEAEKFWQQVKQEIEII